MTDDTNEKKFSLSMEVAQACMDWTDDMGECHLCHYDRAGNIPHDEECPIGHLEELDKGDLIDAPPYEQ